MITGLALVAAALLLPGKGDAIGEALARIRSAVQAPDLSVTFKTSDLVSGRGRLITVEERLYMTAAQQRAVSDREPPPTTATPSAIYFEQIAVLDAQTDSSAAVIPWKSLAAQGHVETCDLGSSGGLHWVGRTTLPFALLAKQAVGSTGGNELRELAARGLKVGDDEQWTKWRVVGILSRPEFEPVVLAELGRHDAATYGECLSALVSDRDTAATEALIYAYWRGNSIERNRAAWPLINEPFRAEAKTTYLDMVRRGIDVTDAARAVQQFGITQALPDLDRIWLTTHDYGAAHAVYFAARSLRKQTEDNPVSRAFHRLVDGTGTSKDLRVYLNGDPTYATMLAFRATSGMTKGGPNPTQFRAHHLLLRIPGPVPHRLIARFHFNFRWLAESEERWRAAQRPSHPRRGIGP